MDDVHRFMGKRKSATGVGSSRVLKKSRPNAPAVATHQTDPPSISIGPTNIPSIKISSAASEMVVALAAPTGLPSA